jgi:glycosyltransferase involved in cell wall biosynthesis
MLGANRAVDHAFVIPAYGDSPFLAACLESLLDQTRSGSRVVVTTSSPSPHVAEIAQHYGVALLVNSRRVSIGCDWNFALVATTAKFVTLAHQDDTYRPDYAAVMLEATQRHPDVLVAFSDYTEVTVDGPRARNLNLRLKTFLCRRAFGRHEAIRTPEEKRRLLAFGNPICCPSVIVNRARLPHFRFDESMRSNLDWDAWLTLAEQPGAFVYAREPLVTRRIHRASETSLVIADERRFAEDRSMFHRLWPSPIATLISAAYRAGYWANRT